MEHRPHADASTDRYGRRGRHVAAAAAAVAAAARRGRALPPDSRPEALAKATAASAALHAAAAELGAQALVGREAGEAAVELEAPLLRASVRRAYASDLRNATIALQPHTAGAVPLSVRLPAAALRLAADADDGDDRGSGDDGGINGATVVDVHLGSWGALGAVDLYGWRDGGGYAQSVVSNITTLALSAAAADGVHRDALRVRGSAEHPLEIVIPVPLPPPPPPPASVVAGSRHATAGRRCCATRTACARTARAPARSITSM